MGEENRKEYITHQEAATLKKMFAEFLKSYKQKNPEVSDKEWLEQLFKKEIPDMREEQAKLDAEEIVGSVYQYDEKLKSVNEAAEKGISKERWLAGEIEKASSGMAVQQYGKTLQAMDDFLAKKNLELAEAMKRNGDGQIKMSPNLDGNIAEHMVAKTAEMSSFLQGKDIKVEVREAYTKNSVDVSVVNTKTGQRQNYQLKFGKDAKATIELIERGNYNNQRIIVPSDQLEEVQAHFKEKGSSKTISDHIEAWGVEGKAFTKEEMKEVQETLQEDGFMPSMDYNDYQAKDLAMSIGKNAGVMALQSMAVTTGLEIANKMFKGEEVNPDELVEIAVKTGADTSVKVVTAGTLQVAIRKGIISFIPKATPAGVIANIACVGIENVKILSKIASGELSMTKGIDQMGRVTTSMVGGLIGMAKGATLGAQMAAWIPIIGAPLAVASGLVGGMVGYFGGSKLGDTVYETGKKVAKVAGNMAKTAINSVKKAGRAVVNKAKNLFNVRSRLKYQ